MATYPQVYETAIKESNLQNGGYIQLEWNSTEHTPLNAGEVCPIDSDYMLFSKHYPSQTSANGFRYSPKFQHKLTQLGYLPLYFKTQDAEGANVVLSTFPYNGNAATIAQYLVACLNEHGDLGTWTVGTISVSGIVSISFDGATIKSGAQQIADAFDTEYYFNYADHTFNLGAITEENNGDGPAYEPGTLVTASDGGIQYNTFRILGGTKNMAKRTLSGQNVAVTERLMLDPTEYPGSIIGSGNPRIMKDIVFDDVYPRMELYMYNLRERRCYLCDDEGNRIPDTYVKDSDNNIVIDPQTGLPQVATYKQYSKWYFRLAYWNGTQLVNYNFDPNLIIADLPLSMVFQPNYADGALDQPLIGREFELTYFSEQTNEHGADDVSDTPFVANAGDYRIIFSVQSGMILPSTSTEMICPYATQQMSRLSNIVTLTNVALDGIYKQAAQAELKKRALEATTAETRDKSSFTYLTYGTPPTLGTTAAGGIVTSVRQDLITTEVQYTVGYYQSTKGAIGRLSDKIESAKGSGGKATTGDDDNQYIHGGVSYNSIPLISKLVGIGSLRLGVDGVRDMLGTKGLLALIGILLYDGIKERLSTSFVTCAIGAYDGSPLNPSIVYNNNALVGNLVTLPASNTDEYAELVLYFEALRTILGTYQFRIFGSVVDGNTYNMYDLWLHKVSLPKLNAAAGYNDGAEVYMWTGTGWEMIREYVRSLIENLGNEIRLLVYGGNGSTGLLMKVNQLTAFSEKFILDGNGNVIGVSGSSLVLTDSSGVLSTKFMWTDDQDVEHEVTASIGTSVYYDQTSGTYKGRLLLDGDNVAINGECISITNNGNPVAVFTNGKLTASLIDVNTLAASLVDTQALNAKYATITSLEALAATIREISADVITVNDVLTAPEFVTSVISAVEGGNITVVNGNNQETFKITQAGDVTVRGTVNADSGYFKGELQGATGTFSGSLTSNDNKVLLTSTGVSGWGLQYTWRGFAVSNNGFTSGDLATIGARLNAGGYDYGRIALVKRPAGTYSSDSQEINIILSGYDGSIEAQSISANAGSIGRFNVNTCLRLNSSITYRTYYKKSLTANSTIYDLSTSNGSVQIINSSADGGDHKAGVILPQLADVYSMLGLQAGTNFCVHFIVCADLGSNNFYVYGRNTQKTSDDKYPWNDLKYPLMTHWDNGKWERREMGAGDSIEFLLIYDSSRTANIDDFDTKYTARIINTQY